MGSWKVCTPSIYNVSACIPLKEEVIIVWDQRFLITLATFTSPDCDLCPVLYISRVQFACPDILNAVPFLPSIIGVRGNRDITYTKHHSTVSLSFSWLILFQVCSGTIDTIFV